MLTVTTHNRIPDVLSDRGKSINWLAKSMGKDYSYVHALVKREQLDSVKYGTLKSVADALGVGVNDLTLDAGNA